MKTTVATVKVPPRLLALGNIIDIEPPLLWSEFHLCVCSTAVFSMGCSQMLVLW